MRFLGEEFVKLKTFKLILFFQELASIYHNLMSICFFLLQTRSLLVKALSAL